MQINSPRDAEPGVRKRDNALATPSDADTLHFRTDPKRSIGNISMSIHLLTRIKPIRMQTPC